VVAENYSDSSRNQYGCNSQIVPLKQLFADNNQELVLSVSGLTTGAGGSGGTCGGGTYQSQSCEAFTGNFSLVPCDKWLLNFQDIYQVINTGNQDGCFFVSEEIRQDLSGVECSCTPYNTWAIEVRYRYVVQLSYISKINNASSTVTAKLYLLKSTTVTDTHTPVCSWPMPTDDFSAGYIVSPFTREVLLPIDNGLHKYPNLSDYTQYYDGIDLYLGPIDFTDFLNGVAWDFTGDLRHASGGMFLFTDNFSVNDYQCDGLSNVHITLYKVT
jgi:hypothetical protein